MAALLVVVARSDDERSYSRMSEEGEGRDVLDGSVLWKELQKHLDGMRKEMDRKRGGVRASWI